jgi:hypothetical protein
MYFSFQLDVPFVRSSVNLSLDVNLRILVSSMFQDKLTLFLRFRRIISKRDSSINLGFSWIKMTKHYPGFPGKDMIQ